MKLFAMVGKDLVDRMIEDSAWTFDYNVFAESESEASDMFAMIFPGLELVSIREI
jgi:hypothetical protein